MNPSRPRARTPAKRWAILEWGYTQGESTTDKEALRKDLHALVEERLAQAKRGYPQSKFRVKKIAEDNYQIQFMPGEVMYHSMLIMEA